MKRRGFTLMELLVTVAIISLLAAILFPVFARARENARRASCMSNLKQIGLGIMMYVQDYDETYPPYREATSQTPPFPAYQSGNWEWQHIIYSYTKNTQLYHCPDGNSTYPAGDYGSYGANYYALHNGAVKMAAVTSPSTLYVIMDSGRTYIDPSYAKAPSGAFYLPGGGLFITPDQSGSVAAGFYQSDYANGRHFDGINVVFGDGHVKWLHSQTVWMEAKNYSSSHSTASAWDPASP